MKGKIKGTDMTRTRTVFPLDSIELVNKTSGSFFVVATVVLRSGFFFLYNSRRHNNNLIGLSIKKNVYDPSMILPSFLSRSALLLLFGCWQPLECFLSFKLNCQWCKKKTPYLVCLYGTHSKVCCPRFKFKLARTGRFCRPSDTTHDAHHHLRRRYEWSERAWAHQSNHDVDAYRPHTKERTDSTMPPRARDDCFRPY